MPYTAVTTSVDLTKKLRYVESWSFAENAGTPAAARLQLKDGGSGGSVVVDVALAANDSKALAYPKPLYFPNGVYVHVTAGTVRGSVAGN